MGSNKTIENLDEPPCGAGRKEWIERQNLEIRDIPVGRNGELEGANEAKGIGDIRESREVKASGELKVRGRGELIGSREMRGSGELRGSRELRGSGELRGSRELRGSGELRGSRELRGSGEIRLRGSPRGSREMTESGELRGSRDFLRVPCASSLSTLTGLSVGSRVLRPCQAVRTSSTGRGASNRRTSPSMLLQHGYDWISAEDERILNIMVMRREAEMENEDLLLSARNLWEKDKIAYNQMMNEKRKQWNEYVQERRRVEKMEQERRKEHAEHSLQRHLAELEEKINERHSRCERRHDQLLIQKRLPRGDVDADELSHRLRREQQQLDEQARSALHVTAVAAKERRVQDNLSAIQCYRVRALNERRSKRERRIEAAQQLRDALNEQFEQWCQQNKQLLTSRLCLCEYRAAMAVDWKRKSAHDANVIKTLHHANAMSLLQDEERARELRARQELHVKEARIRNTLERKELAKRRSRSNALATSDLRQKIKASYHLSR